MGDSLTDRRHWSDRPTCWVDLLRDRIEGRYQVADAVLKAIEDSR